MKNLIAVIACCMAGTSQGMAAEATVILTIPGMQCRACPVAVQRALLRVEGVSKADVSLQTHEAVVNYDDAKTSAGKLVEATAAVGYPSSARKQK
jgi:periplasmic mercuric ion binding protein